MLPQYPLRHQPRRRPQAAVPAPVDQASSARSIYRHRLVFSQVMSIFRFTVTLILLAAVAFAFPGGALALDQASLKLGWGKGLKSSKTVKYGAATTLSGVLSSGGQGLGGKGVVIERKSTEPDAGYQTVELATTASDGSFSSKVKTVPSSTYRASFSSDGVYSEAQATATLNVKASTTLSLSARNLRNRQSLVFSGRIKTAGVEMPDDGKIIALQFRERGRWREFMVDSTNQKGRYRASHRFVTVTSPTRFTFRAFVPTEYGWPFADGFSRAATVTVSP